MRTKKAGESVLQCWNEEQQDAANKAGCNHHPKPIFLSCELIDELEWLEKHHNQGVTTLGLFILFC